MRFSVVAAAFLATAVSAADYGYGAPSSSPSASPSTTAVYSSVVTKHETVTVDCKKDPYNCPHKPTTTVNLHPTGAYGNVSHPVYTPTYPIVPKPPHGGYGNGGKDEDDKYILTTITTTLCVPTTSTYVTKVLKPTTTPVVYKPTGAPVPVPTGGYKATPTFVNTNGAGSLQIGSFAAIAGLAAYILA